MEPPHKVSFRYYSIFKELIQIFPKQQRLILPPLNEQKRIAEILGSVDASIQANRAVIGQAERVKRGLMEELLIGGLGSEAIGRGEMPEGWNRLRFDDVYRVRNRKDKQIPKGSYLEIGAFPIVDQSTSFIAGYCNGQPNEDFPVIIFGDHTRVVKFVDFPFFVGADGTQALYSATEIEPKFAYYLLLNADIPKLGYSRHMRELKRIQFAIPPLTEQKRIAEILSSFDDFIGRQEATIEQQARIKKGLMNDLLTGRVRTV